MSNPTPSRRFPVHLPLPCPAGRAGPAGLAGPVGLAALAALAFALSAAPAAPQELLRSLTGAPDSGQGRSASAGDVDGDGIVDLIAGAPDDPAAGPAAGSARVYSGADGSLLYVLTGGGQGARFGTSCDCAGDVDGDGLDDIIVGAPGAGAGRAFLFSGADGTLLRTLAGGATGDAFGQAVAGVGDVDGDGFADVAVGAPGADVGGSDTGSMSLVSGATGATLGTVYGSASGDALGSSVASVPAGACVGDNEGDVIVGATAAGGDRRGYVQVHALADLALRWHVAGATDQQLGTALANVGDVDGDGVDDVAAGSDPHTLLGEPAAAGTVRVLSGADGTLIREHADGVLGSGYGTVVAGVGDVTGDGVPDIGVGAPLAEDNGSVSGSVYLYSGSDGTRWHTLHGPQPGARFGAALVPAGDVNDDGIPDVAAGARGDAAGSGRVYVLSVSRWEDEGNGLPGLDGIPRLTGEGGLVADNEATLTLTGARADTTATLVLGYALVVDGSTGKLLPKGDVVTVGLLTGSDGTLTYAFTWPEGMPSGTTVYYQFVVSDPDAPGGQARSNTVAATVP